MTETNEQTAGHLSFPDGETYGGAQPRAHASAAVFVRCHSETLSLIALLGATALLYLIGLSASGYANEFYSAAAQAGSTNWWAFLWGSSDAGNSITVDKPPAALWPMALSVRFFGLSSWSILVPQAIMGVLSVWLLYATVRRTYGHWAGILAGAVLATTPIACLMFRFNNPDALLILLLLACTHCVLRACELPDERVTNRSRTRWMALAGVAMGFAFLTKQLQAFLILPGIGIAFLMTSPTGWRRKLLDTLAAFGALIVSAGWWVLLTVVVPADARPYIGGSQTNSFIELTFSYNGLGRITGSMEGAVLPGGASGSSTSTISQGQAGMWGQTGITRLFDGVWGTQWSWLAWVALAGIVVGLVCARKEGRGARIGSASMASPSTVTVSVPLLARLKRAHVVIWGGWLIVTGFIFSFMGGTIHQYYTVALASAVAALVAICVIELWRAREQMWTRVTGTALTLATAVWSIVLLERSDWMWQLRPVVLALALGSMAAAIAAGRIRKHALTTQEADVQAPNAAAHYSLARKSERIERVALALALTSALAGPITYSLYTAATPHTGSIVTAGPTVSGDSGMGGGMGGGPGGMGGAGSGTPNGAGGTGTAAPNGAGGSNNGGGVGIPGGGMGNADGSPQGMPDADSNTATPSDDSSDSTSTDAIPVPPNADSTSSLPDGQGSQSDQSQQVAPQSDQSQSSQNGQQAQPQNGQSGLPQMGAGQASSQGASQDGGGQGTGQGGAGGLLGGSATSVSDELVAALQEDADSYRWVAATVGSQNAASYQLASECPVMPIGGFNGSDPSPTLEQFKEWVAEGQIHYFIAGGVGGGTQIGGSDDASQIAAWVEENFTATTIGNVTVYDLTQTAS